MVMEEATFRVVKALLPEADSNWEQILSEKQSRLYVIVAKHHHHGQIPDNPAVEDFLFLKGHQKLALTRIISAYKGHLELDDDTPLVLKLDGRAISEDTTVGELPNRERLLIMTAELEQPPATQQSNNSGTLSPRPPLQPISRQLTIPPVQSQDENPKATTTGLSPSPAVTTPAPAPTPGRTPLGGVKSEEPSENRGYHVFPVQPESSNRAKGSSTPTPKVAQPPAAVKHESTDPTDSTEANPAAAAPKAEEEEPETQYVPRDQGDLFATSQDDVDFVRGRKLQQLGAETTPERLEAGVRAGLQVLSSIVEPLKKLGDHEDAANWLGQIEKVRKDATRTRTVVGVVGNTGAGKSSVINAMLEEERLVPTNCMRACTAVVTEMSYNDSTNPNMKYRAVIEFIKPEDWEKELHVLFKEIFDDSGNLSKEISNADSEAGIAYAKVRAVYHKHTRDMLANTSVNSLMRQKHVKNVLGKSRKIVEKDPKAFYKSLQQYVDSKEKGQEKLDKNGKKIGERKRDFEYWPLIKVVKIYTKADALSTGACIVDLPGVHDSNAARAAVAEGYMKECTGLWIVAPINRAVDDKAAKTLLGDTFKRQLKYDGTYSAVTFICSKTDDISRMEASDSLNLGEEYSTLEDKQTEKERERKKVRTEIKEKKDQKKDYEDTIDQLEEQIEEWERLSNEMGAGKTVYPPTQKKRKRPSSNGTSSKRRRRSADDSDDDDFIDRSSSEPDEQDSEETAAPLTEEAIEEKLEELKTMKKEARREKAKLADAIADLQGTMDDIAEEMDVIDARQSALCIAGRNEYSRGAIQQDFAAGIRELDQENAADEDPDNFNPEEDLRDYDEVARSLPVFCVSSRAYQKLSGRLKKDNNVPGFRTPEETEVPQLQAHCKKLTEKGRQASCRRFLNNLQSLINSMSLWASDDGSGVKLSSAQRDVERSFLQRKLKELEKALEKTVTDTLEDAMETLNEQLFKKFASGIKAAVDEAIPTSSKWGARKDEGGLHFMTYRATVRRQGVFAGASGQRDFNAELTEPLYKHLASAWEKSFQRRLPHILQTCTKSATDVLKKFHAAIEQRVREKGHGVSRIGILGTQLQAYTAIFGDLVSGAIETLNNGQKEINREFTPVIADGMDPAYSYCAEERGSGCYKRMKSYMADHVSNQRSQMFNTASETVRKSLLKLCGTVKDSMLDKADEVFVKMQRDYLSLVGVQKGEIKMSREERAARREVDDAISAADSHFGKALEADLEDLKLEQPDGDEAGAEAIDDGDEMEVDDETENEDVDEDDDEADEGADESHDEAASRADPDEAASVRDDEDE